MSFEKNLNRLMKERGLSRYRISKDLGVSPQTACNWADGKSIPDTKSAIKLAEYFGVTVESLMK